MEIKEAIECLKGCIVSEERENGMPNGNVTCDLTREILNIAISALEKQVEMRPLHTKVVWDEVGDAFLNAQCPNCGSYFPISDEEYELCPKCEKFPFCPSCGQKIDWSSDPSEHTTGNTVHLCESCQSTYPECPGSAKLIFGDGRGNTNICACSEYKPLAKREWAKRGKEEIE